MKNKKKITKKLIFLGYMDDPLKANKYIKKLFKTSSHENNIILSINRCKEMLEKSLKIKINYMEDYLHQNDYKHLNDYVFSMSENWFKWLPAKENITKFNSFI